MWIFLGFRVQHLLWCRLELTVVPCERVQELTILMYDYDAMDRDDEIGLAKVAVKDLKDQQEADLWLDVKPFTPEKSSHKASYALVHSIHTSVQYYIDSLTHLFILCTFQFAHEAGCSKVCVATFLPALSVCALPAWKWAAKRDSD
jgi:hypothetical protein